MEFRGVLTARPVQERNAARFGLTPSEAQARAQIARGLLAAFESVGFPST